ncbi:MAG: hypothetical protein IT288_18300 [Bdellovibrionales bacterium]|nr:hypothetical protein [Bdellovibrionales bacterium]
MEKAKSYSLNVKVDETSVESLMVSDILFHTPIISLALLVIAHARKELTVAEMPNWIGAVLSNSFWGTKTTNRKLEWSIVLRNRYADALIFLEANRLVSVKGRHRTITVSDEGKKFLQKSQRRTDTFGQLIRGFKVSTSEVAAKGFTLL